VLFSFQAIHAAEPAPADNENYIFRVVAHAASGTIIWMKMVF
jgi:hypothetical protein